MSWVKAADSSLNYWKDIVPGITNTCISNNKALMVKEPALSSRSGERCSELSSLYSSQFSEQSTNKKTNVWTAAEDQILIEKAVSKNYNWAELTKYFPNTSPLIIEKRWKTLNENSPKVEWTQEQDRLILKLYQMHGGHWKKIANFFPGISSSSIKTRFFKSLKRKSEELDQRLSGNFESDNRPLIDLTDEEKRLEIQNLYQRKSAVQNSIETTRKKIKELTEINRN